MMDFKKALESFPDIGDHFKTWKTKTVQMPDEASYGAIRAALRLASAIQDGRYVVVPSKPTEDMVCKAVATLPVEWRDEADRYAKEHNSTSAIVRNLFAVEHSYSAMLKAAPDVWSELE